MGLGDPTWLADGLEERLTNQTIRPMKNTGIASTTNAIIQCQILNPPMLFHPFSET